MKRCAALLALILAGCGNEPPAIHKWGSMFTSEWSTDKAHQFVISNPPDGQQALIELISSYLKSSPPPGFWEGEYSAAFYRESRVTPVDENERPESNWWDWLITSCRSANNIMPITISPPARTVSFFYSA